MSIIIYLVLVNAFIRNEASVNLIVSFQEMTISLVQFVDFSFKLKTGVNRIVSLLEITYRISSTYSCFYSKGKQVLILSFHAFIPSFIQINIYIG